MFERKIEQEFKRWKDSNSPKRKALVVRGLRQIGKTYTARHFAESNYESVILIDFKLNSEMKQVFEGSLDVDRLTVDFSSRKMIFFYSAMPTHGEESHAATTHK